MAPSGDMVKMDQKLRNLLRRTRERTGLSQSQIAQLAGVSASYYKKIEQQSRVNVSIPAMLDICNALQVQPAQLREIGHHSLARELAEQRKILGLETGPGDPEPSPYRDPLERYLWNAPGSGPDGRADVALRLSLIAFSRTIREMQAQPDEPEPYAGMYLRTRRD